MNIFFLLSYSNDSFFQIGGDNGLDGFPGLIGMKGEFFIVIFFSFILMNFIFFAIKKVVLVYLVNVSDYHFSYRKIFMIYFNLGGLPGGSGTNGLPGFPGPKGLPGKLFPKAI
jgi:hypothetical protein